MNSFVARTRVRNKVDFYPARWTEKPKVEGEYTVEFLDGPHKGEIYNAIDVAKASDKWR